MFSTRKRPPPRASGLVRRRFVGRVRRGEEKRREEKRRPNLKERREGEKNTIYTPPHTGAVKSSDRTFVYEWLNFGFVYEISIIRKKRVTQTADAAVKQSLVVIVVNHQVLERLNTSRRFFLNFIFCIFRVLKIIITLVTR